MAHSPSVPDRPRLHVDPEMSTSERLQVYREHYFELVQVNRALKERVATVTDRVDELRDRSETIERENRALKSAALYIATVQETFDDSVILRQHGTNQEIVTDLESIEPVAGDRVAVNDMFDIQTILDGETDARAQAMQVEESPDVTYADIGGLDDQLQEVRETVELPLLHPEQFETVGIDPPSGVLLHGPPGTGKTLMAKAVANETDTTYIRMAGSELVHKFIGEGAKLVRDLFDVARSKEPAVLFIDEIDAIASKRTDSKTSGDAEVQRTMMQLLAEMDGFEDRGEIRIIAATNRFDMLDRAILRPGRFDRLIEVPEPDAAGRTRIFTIHTRRMNIDDEVDFTLLAEETDGASGADIKAICTEAGMFAIRDDRTEVTRQDFDDAWEKILGEDEDDEVSMTFA